VKQLAFVLLRYFPHGGQQRDFMRIARLCQQRGHSIRVYTTRWQGDLPEGFEVRQLPVRAWRQHHRYPRFAEMLRASLEKEPVDCVIGFNRLPGLDLYYAADPCFVEKALRERGPYYRWTARYRQLRQCERAVFAAPSCTEILVLTRLQRDQYLRHYPEAEPRLNLLPPGLASDRVYPADAAQRRQKMREQCGLKEGSLLLLQVGSGFAVKGVARSIKALAALPMPLRERCYLVIVGDDHPRYYRTLARGLQVAGQCEFVGSRDDVPDWMLAADLLLHPAISESAGHVLLEALLFGLPVLATDTCGYANHVQAADAGWVCPSPFRQSALNVSLQQILSAEQDRQRWHQNALQYCQQHNLYGLDEAVLEHIERLAVGNTVLGRAT